MVAALRADFASASISCLGFCCAGKPQQATTLKHQIGDWLLKAFLRLFIDMFMQENQLHHQSGNR